MALRTFKCDGPLIVFAPTQEEVFEVLAQNAKEPMVCRLMHFGSFGRGLVDLWFELHGADGLTMAIGASIHGWGTPEELTVHAAAARVAEVFARFRRHTEEPVRTFAPPPKRLILAQSEFILA